MWTVRLNGIPERINDKAVTIKGKVYSFDSFDTWFRDGEKISGFLDDVYTSDPASYRWGMLEALALPADGPINILGRSVVAYGHCAYL
ncbi:hypothetical protein V5799_010216 [Amblyomma americanum]|uniref:Uncharacterized protein n=1 Tax=Amblyomma americanum TaxID=6943 RepID=A0AAQ4F8P6_AMBAM